MSFGGIKRDKYDAVFSDLVRERADWTCEVCGKYFPEGTRAGIHNSHLFGRGMKGTRWNADNCSAMCFSCHKRLGENPVAHTAWAVSRLGQGLVDILHEKASKPYKVPKHEKEEMHKHYKAELKRLQSLRKQGVTGRLEFEGWQ